MTLAIKGHATRGKEVIEILEMLGGKNQRNYNGDSISSIYYLNNDKIIDFCNGYCVCAYKIFTLKEFLEKFPYKVGDKVQHRGATSCVTIYEIEGLKWTDNQVEYKVHSLHMPNCHCIAFAGQLQPYKEQEPIEEQKLIPPYMDYDVRTSKMNSAEVDLERFIVSIPKGYEFVGVDNQQVVFEKVKPQYPKTYEECCKIKGVNSKRNIEYARCETDYSGQLISILNKFMKLLICRDAYCKIAGEQMGLGKPWEPDWNNLSTTHEFIKINKGCFTYSSRVLVFPTEEMRDAFYENFKELINECKELL